MQLLNWSKYHFCHAGLLSTGFLQRLTIVLGYLREAQAACSEPSAVKAFSSL